MLLGWAEDKLPLTHMRRRHEGAIFAHPIIVGTWSALGTLSICNPTENRGRMQACLPMLGVKG